MLHSIEGEKSSTSYNCSKQNHDGLTLYFHFSNLYAKCMQSCNGHLVSKILYLGLLVFTSFHTCVVICLILCLYAMEHWEFDVEKQVPSR